jgi:hypothetical protein
MFSDLHLSESPFKLKDDIRGNKKCHRMAIPSYEIYSKELKWFTSLNQTDISFPQL